MEKVKNIVYTLFMVCYNNFGFEKNTDIDLQTKCLMWVESKKDISGRKTKGGMNLWQ